MSALAKKLYIKPGQTWLILDPPEDYLASLEPLPEGVTILFTPDKQLDGAQLFVRNSVELGAALARVISLLKEDAVVWAIHPKKASGIDTDLGMMSSWDAPAQYGLRPVASAAINDHWTAIRLRQETLVKKSDTSRQALKAVNDYSAYIDTEARTVKLPEDAMDALQNSPAAIDFFDKLSFTNKKEYVVWILSAKQEQTRNDRIAKTLEKLLSGKKNPSEK